MHQFMPKFYNIPFSFCQKVHLPLIFMISHIHYLFHLTFFKDHLHISAYLSREKDFCPNTHITLVFFKKNRIRKKLTTSDKVLLAALVFSTLIWFVSLLKLTFLGTFTSIWWRSSLSNDSFLLGSSTRSGAVPFDSVIAQVLCCELNEKNIPWFLDFFFVML